MNLGRNTLVNTCWVRESGFYQVLNAVSDDVKKRFDGEITFHWKRIKVMLKSLWKSRLKKFCARLYQTSSLRAQNIVHENHFVSVL